MTLVPGAHELIEWAIDRHLMDMERGAANDPEAHKRRRQEVQELLNALDAELKLVEDIVFLAGSKGISADDALIQKVVPLLGRERTEGLRELGEKLG